MAREYDEEEDSSGHNRPRRSNVDTVSYLRGLPLDIEAAKAEISCFLEKESGDDFPQSLAAALSAIDEIRMEIASLAGDEYGSQCIEVIANVSAPYSEIAARVLLAGCSGYHLHMATHRYGSHVVQTILQLSVSSCSETDLALHEEAPQFKDSLDTLPTLSELIHEMVEELAPHVATLAVHVCGSHVLRTLVSVLGGVDLVSASPNGSTKVETGAILRGKKKSKKKKKRKPTVDESNVPHAGTMNIVYRKDARIKVGDFSSSLKSLTLALLGKPSNQPGELQQLAIHPSGGPLLIVLLRVLTYSTESAEKELEIQNSGSHKREAIISDFRLGISRQEPCFANHSLAHNMVQRILCWQEDATEQEHVGSIIYGLSGEARGSHLLETMLRLAPDDVYESIIKCGGFESPSSMQEYVEHDVSNFVIQTLLTTIREKEQAEAILKIVEKIISSGLAIDATRKRRGILWRSAELAAKFRVGQESLLKAVRLGFGAINAASGEINDGVDSKKKKQRKKASAVDIKDCVSRLISLRRPDQEGDRIILDAAGTRSVYHMLRFSPRLCEDVLNGIVEDMTTEDLLLVAKDGLGSRCILDGILDGPVTSPIFIAATKSLLAKLKGHWVSLSTDRVGHHTVKKMFKALPKIDDKAKLVEELESGGNRMSGNSMGRNVVETCFVDVYRENRKEWRKTVSKMQGKEETPLEDVISKTAESDEGKPKSKRKRKRKKANKDGEDSEEKPSKKSQKDPKADSFSVDSIMKAMTVPN